MIYNPYEILGVSPEASREEIDDAYRRVREELRNKRMESGLAGEEAAEKLQYLEQSYSDLIDRARRRDNQEDSTYDPYEEIKEEIKKGNIAQAQVKLDAVVNRDAEWHYVQSTIYFKKNWYIESKKQLEFAVSMAPDNSKYTESLDRLVKYLASNSVSPDQMRSNTQTAAAPTYSNNGTCTGSCCGDMCLANLCANCICGGCS